ncbi:MAG: PEGA domain-containing protein [bacterium]|nr:PEGA domain-containing protein [bacterium]
MLVYTSKNEKLTLSDDTMSAGGEGEIHLVISGPARFNNVCVKIYYKSKRTAQLESKLKYMVNHPPNQICSESFMVGWPLETVYDNQKKFIGFVMPIAYSNSKPLIVLTSIKLSKKLSTLWTDKYDRKLGASSIISRLKLICNIAIPIHILHSTGKYILKDFKPDNVLVTADGKVTLVDMDSIQITENNRLLYNGTAATPEYIPPEFYTQNVGKNINVPIKKSWDYFAVGVVFYQIIFGLHPYTVTPAVAKDDSCNEIFQNISQNLFPFGLNSAKVASYPPPHKNFNHIPLELQQLFQKAFSDMPTTRPSLEQWVKTLKELIQKAPKITPQALGTISIKCTPSASVWMDNAYKGTTPISIRAKVGFHSIELSYNGNSKSFKNVEVKKDDTTYIDAKLDKFNSNKNKDSEGLSKLGCVILFLVALISSVVVWNKYSGINKDKDQPAPIYEDSVLVVDNGLEEVSPDSTKCDSVPYDNSDSDEYISDISPSANIENIWMEHNAFNRNTKGMFIHIKFNNSNLRGERLTVGAYFFKENNVTPLYDRYGNELYFSLNCVPNFDESTYQDFVLFIPYKDLNMPPGTNDTFSFDITITDPSGEELARENNNRFDFRSNSI